MVPSLRVLLRIAAVTVLLAGLVTTSPVRADDAGERDAVATQFRNPLNPGADPTLRYAAGAYRLLTTQGDAIRMWSSPSLSTLLNAPVQEVFKDPDETRNKQVWAPALYAFDGRWYIYYTASDGVDANHRNYVIESEGDDPVGPYHFKARIADPGTYAIDGEPIVIGGARYFAWAAPGRGGGGPNQTYLQRMDTPWSTTGPVTALPVANGACPEVREGPTALSHGGRTFLTYSSCDTGKPDYAIYMISIADTADPMVPGNWTRHPAPLLQRNDAAGVYGPGHHSFFTSPDGSQTWIAYHAKNTSAYTYSWRTTRAQPVTWNADGTPHVGPALAQGASQPLPAGDPGTGGPTAIDDTDEGTGDMQVSYAGAWNHSGACGVQCFNGNDHWSAEPGATATFRFTGTQIALLSVRDVGNGIAAISVDGGAEQRVDFHGSPRVGESLQYLSPRLAVGAHTLTVRVAGEHNGSASAAYVSIDRAEVYP